MSASSWSRLQVVWSFGTSKAARAVAWLALIGATAALVRGEVNRPEGIEGVRVYTDLVYREHGGRRVRLDVYEPVEPAPKGGRPVLVAIHGGGWRGGSKSDYGRSLAPLVRQGLVVVAVDYRLSGPGAPSWPVNLEDVRASVRWVRRHASDYGIDPDRLALIGASAGGHLALLLGNGSVDQRDSVCAVIDFYGPTDLAGLYASRTVADGALGLFLGGSPGEMPARYQTASPIRRIAPGGPPVLIVHGLDDTHVPLEQSRLLASALEKAGIPHRLIEIEGARHGFGLKAGSRDLVPDILAFLQAAWTRSTSSKTAGPLISRPRRADPEQKRGKLWRTSWL